MMIFRNDVWCLLTACHVLLAVPALAVDKLSTPEDEKGIFNVVFENDIFANSDRGYTNGVRAACLSSEAGMPPWTRWAANHLLPVANHGKKRISVAVGQSMFAPEDLTQPKLITTDRPYAGWLYGSLGVVSDTGKTLDNVVLTVGVVGPYAYAKETQKLVHRLVGSPRPEGWANQLHHELVVNLVYERKWRKLVEFTPFGFGVDMTPDASVTLGNVNTSAAVGATFRLGYDLPADYGPPRIRPSLPGSDFFLPTQKASGYLFAGIQARAVARDIFLDGNTFRESPHVEKKLLVGNLQTGIAVTYNSARISYTHVFMSKEFDRQVKPAQFGAVSFSYRF